MVTLKDVAEKCGVSVSTVSRAMNGVDLINAGRAEEIRAAAREMGYAPNAVARTLKTKRSMTIGILYEARFDHPYFSLLFEAVRSNAEKREYDLLLLSRVRKNGRLDYSETALSRQMDGVIIVYANPGAYGVLKLLSGNIPVVSVDRCDRECPSVSSDYRQGTRAQVEAAVAKGHRRIAFLYGQMGYATHERLVGFQEALAENGLEAKPEYLRPVRFNDFQLCAEETQKLLELPEPPTCILMPDDFSALNALQILRERGILAPRDFSCMGYDGIGWTQRLSPHLTTYKQNIAAIGEAVLDAVTADSGSFGTHQAAEMVVTGEFIPGETLASIP